MFKLEKIVNSTNSAPEQTMQGCLYDDAAVVGISGGTVVGLADGEVYPVTGNNPAYFMTAGDAKLEKMPADLDNVVLPVKVFMLSQDMIFKAPVEGNAYTMVPGAAYAFNDNGTGLTTENASAKRGAVVVEVVSATEVLCVINQNLPSGRQE